MKKLVLVIAGLVFSTNSFAASFNCDKAATFVEKAICNNEEIGKLDDELAANFKAMKNSDIGKGSTKDLISTQKKWLSVRNKCTNDQCLIDSYSKRIEAICEYPVISGVHPC